MSLKDCKFKDLPQPVLAELCNKLSDLLKISFDIQKQQSEFNDLLESIIDIQEKALHRFTHIMDAHKINLSESDFKLFVDALQARY